MRRALLSLILVASGIVTAMADDYRAIMATGTYPPFPIQSGTFFSYSGTTLGGIVPGDWTWNDGPAESMTILGDWRALVLNSASGTPVWILGDLNVGMGSYGGRDLNVLGTIKAGPEAATAPRWLGIQSSDPSGSPGDTYKNSESGKVRIFDGTDWNDLN